MKEFRTFFKSDIPKKPKHCSADGCSRPIFSNGRPFLLSGDILRDSIGTQSLDYGNRLLKNVVGVTVINWDGHSIYDSDSLLVLNWDDRQLFNTTT